MNTDYKSIVVFVLAAMLTALITGCAGMESYGGSVSDNYYSTLAADSGDKAPVPAQKAAPAREPDSPAQALFLEGLRASGANDHATAAEKFKQIIDKDLCSSETSGTAYCISKARVSLAFSYEVLGRPKDALSLYRKVADQEISNRDKELGKLICNSRFGSGKLLMKDKRYDDAFQYYDAAYTANSSDSDLCGSPGMREEIFRGMVSSAKGQKNGKRMAAILKPGYYNQPTSANLKDYYAVLKQAGDKAEINNVDKFHKKVMPEIEKWEKLYAPTVYADESAKIQYNTRRATFYTNVLKGVKKLGLKGYDDYLIAQVRTSREAAESAQANQRYQEEAAQSRAQQDAEDAAMMNMFMNILTAPRY
ncbi:MAG: hypothetical protein HZC51_05480 [Nitrospirae bacterium]|nr:hypothetical protein [Nitrospirota bacterium]